MPAQHPSAVPMPDSLLKRHQAALSLCQSRHLGQDTLHAVLATIAQEVILFFSP